MPPKEGRRGDKEGDPAVTRQDATRRREQDPVDRPQPRWAGRPLQHPELMAEDEDLEVLASVVSALVDEVLAAARAVTLEVLGDSAAAAVFVEQRLRAGSR